MNPEQLTPSLTPASATPPMAPTATPQPMIPATPVAPVLPSMPAFTPQPIQNVYPQVPETPTVPAPAPMSSYEKMREQEYKQASTGLNDLVTLVLGLLSFSTYIFLEQIIKNFWASVVAANLVAFGAIFYANKNYKNNGTTSPLGIVGISAATFTFTVTIMAVVSYIIIRTRTKSYY